MQRLATVMAWLYSSRTEPKRHRAKRGSALQLGVAVGTDSQGLRVDRDGLIVPVIKPVHLSENPQTVGYAFLVVDVPVFAGPGSRARWLCGTRLEAKAPESDPAGR